MKPKSLNEPFTKGYSSDFKGVILTCNPPMDQSPIYLDESGAGKDEA